jgi:hypothetical protein
MDPFLQDRLWGQEDQGHQQNQLRPSCLEDQPALAILPVLEGPLGRVALVVQRALLSGNALLWSWWAYRAGPAITPGNQQYEQTCRRYKSNSHFPSQVLLFA